VCKSLKRQGWDIGCGLPLWESSTYGYMCVGSICRGKPRGPVVVSADKVVICSSGSSGIFLRLGLCAVMISSLHISTQQPARVCSSPGHRDIVSRVLRAEGPMNWHARSTSSAPSATEMTGVSADVGCGPMCSLSGTGLACVLAAVVAAAGWYCIWSDRRPYTVDAMLRPS